MKTNKKKTDEEEKKQNTHRRRIEEKILPAFPIGRQTNGRNERFFPKITRHFSCKPKEEYAFTITILLRTHNGFIAMIFMRCCLSHSPNSNKQMPERRKKNKHRKHKIDLWNLLRVLCVCVFAKFSSQMLLLDGMHICFLLLSESN